MSRRLTLRTLVLVWATAAAAAPLSACAQGVQALTSSTAGLVGAADAAPHYRSRADSLTAVATRVKAERAAEMRIVVELHSKQLWVVSEAQDTLLAAAVGIGLGTTLEHNGKVWTFDTPRGVRTVRGKKVDPVWVPPDWHYVEIARQHELKLAKLPLKGAVRLSDGSRLLVRDGEVGRIEAGDTVFVPLVLDEHIVFENTLFIPPIGTRNRQIAGELGRHALDTGNGYLLHGTPHQNSIGRATSHGCIRMRDEDIAWLYDNVPVGTKVYIY